MRMHEGKRAGGHDRQESELQRGETKNSAQTDFTLYQDFRESDARRFTVSIFKNKVQSGERSLV